ncbi:MAG: DoxX family protein [Pseudomonadota bacterium]
MSLADTAPSRASGLDAIFDAAAPYAALIGRIGIAAIFIQAGINKIFGYAGTAAYMDSVGVPGILLPAVIFIEIVGGLAVLIGWQTRLFAFLLAGFTVLAGVMFHFQPDNQAEMISFMKNLAIAGGFLFLTAFGAGALSLDGRKRG